LIALLWLLQEDHSAPLLLEEPELSLNEEIVRQLHRLFYKVVKRDNQVFVTTHSYALLSNEGIPSSSIFTIIPGVEGSRIEPPTKPERIAIQKGIPPGDVVLARGEQFALEI
jgi:predicted ATPase